MSDPFKVAFATLFLTFFLDLLDLAFARIASFVFTLRFLLYFILHLIISALACLLLHSAISDWYLLALIGTFLGVGVLSNSDVKIGGMNLVPMATLFSEIKAKMVAQAAEDKAKELLTKLEVAQLSVKLDALTVEKLRGYASAALLGAKWKNEKIQTALRKATDSGNEKLALAELMLRNNLDFVKNNIDGWR